MAATDDQPVITIPERFEWFYEREYHRVVSLAYALCGSWWLAEDLAQEAFLAAHRHWDRVSRLQQPAAGSGGWLPTWRSPRCGDAWPCRNPSRARPSPTGWSP